MKYFNVVILFFFVISACSKSPVIPDKEINPPKNEEENKYGLDNDGLQKLSQIKVMTYNIHACNPPSKPGIADLNAVAEAIIKADPDIVLLQEVDKKTGRNGYLGDQAEELGKLTRMNSQYYSAIIYMSGYYGIAILSKYPLYHPKKFLLPKEAGAEQRVLGTAIVDLPGIDSIMVACTHLQHNNANNRITQIKDVIKFLSNTAIPIIIGGDFNEVPTTSNFFSVFDASFTRSCTGPQCPSTFSTANPNKVIDYLAFKPDNAFEVISHQVVDESYASDHFPVMATFKIKR